MTETFRQRIVWRDRRLQSRITVWTKTCALEKGPSSQLPHPDAAGDWTHVLDVLAAAQDPSVDDIQMVSSSELPAAPAGATGGGATDGEGWSDVLDVLASTSTPREETIINAQIDRFPQTLREVVSRRGVYDLRRSMISQYTPCCVTWVCVSGVKVKNHVWFV